MDQRIAAYVAEVSQPGIPYMNNSHGVLRELYITYGRETIDQLLSDHWATQRQKDALRGIFLVNKKETNEVHQTTGL